MGALSVSVWMEIYRLLKAIARDYIFRIISRLVINYGESDSLCGSQHFLLVTP